MIRFTIRHGIFAALIAVALPFAGCGNAPGNVASIGFVSVDIKPDGLTLGKGGGTLIGVQAFDSAGKAIDVPASSFEWDSSNADILTAKTLGSAALVSGKVDWFDTVPPPPNPGDGGAADDSGTADGGVDAGDPNAAAMSAIQTGTPYEPKATLSVTYNGSGPKQTISVPVSIVINVAGKWHVVIVGLTEQDLTLVQQGRLVSYQGTNTNASGSVNGNQFTLNQQGFVLTGTFSSPTDAGGTFTGPGNVTGTWSAHKIN